MLIVVVVVVFFFTKHHVNSRQDVEWCIAIPTSLWPISAGILPYCYGISFHPSQTGTVGLNQDLDEIKIQFYT